MEIEYDKLGRENWRASGGTFRVTAVVTSYFILTTMAHNAHLLNNMNLNPETLKLAKTVLREATLKTKPGSGYEIRSLSTGLPAICAFIACDRYEFTQSWKIELRRQMQTSNKRVDA
jgi:hypothetical protein